jgi:hypothetical protein
MNAPGENPSRNIETEDLKTPRLEHALNLLFPSGTWNGKPGIGTLPFLATDVFAAAAYLIERGGVYHRIVPSNGPKPDKGTLGVSAPTWSHTNLLISKVEVETWRGLGEDWYRALIELAGAEIKVTAAAMASQKHKTAAERHLRKCIADSRDTVGKVQIYWDELLRCYRDPLVTRPNPTILDWWKPALALLIISDEACKDLGYHITSGTPLHPIEQAFERALYLNRDPITECVGSAYPAHEIYKYKVNTFTAKANTFLARVVPKSRTSSLGCSMRNLSHNVALVPPHGIVDLNWYRRLRFYEEDREPLNILLVPFPFKIGANCFRAEETTTSLPRDPVRTWGAFRVDQRWLNSDGIMPAWPSATTAVPWSFDQEIDDTSAREIAEFVSILLGTAEKDCGQVHGVVLPELSLNWPAYVLIVQKLCETAGDKPRIDFLVSGCSSNGMGDIGNYVLTTTFSKNDLGEVRAFTHARAKHHRWQLTGPQITDYGIASALDPNITWWEGNELPRREIDLTVFRRGAMFSAMICEDLARSDPCHDPLRSVGPNIVFALLMDGPQLQTRWSARYATALADDPGSSVLTLSSWGLIDRVNKHGRYPFSRHVALWKDDTGRTIPLELPQNSQGILLTLSGAETTEVTLDGRASKESQAWRYHGHIPIALSDPAKLHTYNWILGLT